jgi:hypothetical protein
MRALALIAFAVVALVLASCELAPSKPSADLVVTPEGKLFLNGNPVAEKDLVAALKAAHAQQPDLYLYIRTDGTATSLPPNIALVYKAIQESGVPGGESTQYKEQEQARRLKSLLGDILFFGGNMLLAVCVVTPFALRAKTASSARRTAVLGILGVGCLIGAVIGGYMDYKSASRGHGVWLTSVFMLIYFVPLSLVTGVIAGNLCWLIVRRRTKATAGPRPPP